MGNCCTCLKSDYNTFDTNEDAFDIPNEPESLGIQNDIPSSSVTRTEVIVVEKTEKLESKPLSKEDSSGRTEDVRHKESKAPESKAQSTQKNATLIDLQYEDNTTNFPFLRDSDTISHIKQSNVMFIMRGPPGSGKSTLVNLLQKTYSDRITICSSDHYHMRNGEYNFDINHLPYAHQSCQEKAIAACQERKQVVVIDNTNIRRWEMKRYLDAAKENCYAVVLVVPRTDWRNSPEMLAQRNIHNVDIATIRKKIKDFEELVPFYYAWYLNRRDSEIIVDMAKSFFLQCVKKIPEVSSKIFTDGISDLSESEILSHFGLDQTKQRMLHCTAKFLGSKKNPAEGRMEYYNNPNVNAALGRVYSLKITGLTITPRTLGVRVALTQEQLMLYDKPEEIRPSETVNIGKGRAAHLTIASAENIRPVHTNYDLLKICDLERRNVLTSSVQVERGSIKLLGEDFCVVDFDRPLEVNTIFTGLY